MGEDGGDARLGRATIMATSTLHQRVLLIHTLLVSQPHMIENMSQSLETEAFVLLLILVIAWRTNFVTHKRYAIHLCSAQLNL